jgi:glucose-6-phosphate 1-dehydrogenase
MQVVHDSVKEHARTPFREDVWEQLADGCRFVPGDFGDNDAFDRLGQVIHDLDRVRGTDGNHAFYLSIPPKFFPVALDQLKRSGLSVADGDSWRRVVIEKPFGHDLASSRELNSTVAEVFSPESVFRIDHYLGKETVQNLLALRFANNLFEPVWNRAYVDHVQITMAEDIGIGGGPATTTASAPAAT